MRPIALLLGLLGMLGGLPACGTAAAPGPEPGGASQLPVGRTFDVIGATEGGRNRPLVAKAGIRFAADGTTSIATGCNRASGRARVHDGKLVSDGFSITEMGCLDPGVSEQETFVMSVVGAQPSVVLVGDVLTLRTATAEIRFLDRKVADPDRPLEGTRWRVSGLFDPQLASSIALPQGELVLAAGRVRFFGPCHDAEGPAAVAGSTVTFGPVSTGPARPCDQDQQRSEAGVLRILDGPVRATVTAGALRLERADGSGVDLVEAT